MKSNSFIHLYLLSIYFEMKIKGMDNTMSFPNKYGGGV